MSTTEFLRKIKSGAILGWERHRILPSITGAQGILEGASGTSKLAQAPYYNQFGIKASPDWTGKKVKMMTWEEIGGRKVNVEAEFRWYDSIEESVADHASFFTSTEWRKNNYKAVVGEKDYRKAARALQNAGYATDSQYANKLIRLIETHGLRSWDEEAFSGSVAPTLAPVSSEGAMITPTTETDVVGRYSIEDLEYKDDLLHSPKGESVIYNPTLNDAYGFQTKSGDVLWIDHVLEVNSEDPQEIMDEAVKYMKENAQPDAQYRVKLKHLPDNISIGDTGMFVDHKFNPPLYIEARILEIVTSISNPENDSVVVGNVREVKSQTDASIRALQKELQDTREKLVDDYFAQKELGVSIQANNGLALIDTGVTHAIELIAEPQNEIKLVANTPYKINLNAPIGENVRTYELTGELLDNIFMAEFNDIVNPIVVEPEPEIDEELISGIVGDDNNNETVENLQGDKTAIVDSAADFTGLRVKELNFKFYDATGALVHEEDVPVNINSRISHSVFKEDVIFASMAITSKADVTVQGLSFKEPSIFGDGAKTTDLIAHFNFDIPHNYIWTRVSDDDDADLLWNDRNKFNNSNNLKITIEDINGNKSTFILTVYDEKGNVIAGTSETVKVDKSPDKISAEVEEAILEGERLKQKTEQAYNDAVAEAKRSADEADALIRDEIEQEIGAVESELSTAKQEAINASNKALADAKAHADAEVQASKEYFDNLIDEVESDVADAQATADSAVNQIDTAVTNAGFTSLDDTIQNVRGIASGVKSELDVAIENAGFTSLDEVVSDTRHLGETANSNAQTAISEAQTAQANSLTALGKANNALEGVSDLDLRVDEVEGELELKADNTFMTEDGELITLSNAITINAHRFSSDMQRIESRVESLSGEINLVILSDAFEGTRLVSNETYPNPSTGSQYGSSDTMREMIVVEEGEQLALSKQTVDIGYNWWTYNFYDDDYNYVSRSGTSANEYVLTIPNGVSKLWVSYPKGSQPQIVRGTNFIPYRPNLADQMTSDEVRVFRNEYDEFAEGTQRRITAIDGSGGRLETAETLINQTADGLSTTVGKVDSQETRISNVEQTADGLQKTVSNKASIAQVTQIADGLNALVQNKPKSIALNGDFSNGTAYWTIGTDIDFYRVEENRARVWLNVSNDSTTGNAHRIFNNARFLSGRKYRVTFDAFTPGGGTTSTEKLKELSVGQSGAESRNQKVTITDVLKSYEIIYHADRNGAISFYLHDWGTYEIGNIEVVETNQVSQAQISVLSDSITQSVSDLDGRVSAQQIALDSISTTVYDEHADKIATQQLTIDGLQTTVADKANQSQVTQLATGLNDLVQNKPKSIALNGDFSSGRSYWTFGTDIDFYRIEENRARVWLNSDSQSTIGSVNRMFNNERFLSGRKYRVTFDAFGAFGATTTKEISVGQSESTRNQKVTITETLQTYEIIYHADRNGPISFYLHNWGQYEIGNIEVVETNQISQAQISVLENNINLRVSKGELLSQINIEAERTLIQSNKLVLDSESVVFTGSAFIPSAQIQSIDAKKITTGTIDTARLDAGDIVTEGLTANVIKSTYIQADELLVDKVFANQASVDRLWAKEIWSNKITTMELEAGQIKSGTIDTARLNATDIVTKGLTADVVTSTHIKSDDALIDELFATSALIERLTSKTAFVNQLKAIDLVADKATFISTGFNSLNSQATINGHAIRIQNSAGEFVEMNNTPELRSDDAGGTAVVLGKGRVQFYDSRGHAKGYVGTDMHTAGSYDFGTYLSKGTGIYRFARMADATETTYAYYTVKAGITTPSPIITDMVRTGLLPDGNAQQFVAKGNMISELNGWPAYPNWPALSVGQKIRYKELSAQTTGDAYEDIWKFGPSSEGDWRIYFAKHARFEGGFTDVSDRRIKHDILPTTIEALPEIEKFDFKEYKMNSDGRHVDLGLIAQEAGILRVADDEVEGIDIQKGIMLALKGIQELQEEIKRLKEIINQ